MKGINVVRWLLGGIVAGIVVWILEGLASMLYMEDMETAMQAHNLAVEMSAAAMILTLVVSLLSGLVLVFFYAAARPRFGPGPKTAVIVAVAFWIGGMLVSLLGYQMMGLFPAGMLFLWGIIGLVEMIIASLVGGWIYKEA